MQLGLSKKMSLRLMPFPAASHFFQNWIKSSAVFPGGGLNLISAEIGLNPCGFEGFRISPVQFFGGDLIQFLENSLIFVQFRQKLV